MYICIYVYVRAYIYLFEKTSPPRDCMSPFARAPPSANIQCRSVCPSTHIHVCISINLSMNVSFFLYLCIYTYIYLYISIQIDTCLAIWLFIYLSIYLNTYTHICIYIYINTYINIYIYIYIYIHADLHIYNYICASPRGPPSTRVYFFAHQPASANTTAGRTPPNSITSSPTAEPWTFHPLARGRRERQWAGPEPVCVCVCVCVCVSERDKERERQRERGRERERTREREKRDRERNAMTSLSIWTQEPPALSHSFYSHQFGDSAPPRFQNWRICSAHRVCILKNSKASG